MAQSAQALMLDAMNTHGVFRRRRVMERVEHSDDHDLIELGVATIETRGVGFQGEAIGLDASYELSDQ
jgi:hypothetical protein